MSPRSRIIIVAAENCLENNFGRGFFLDAAAPVVLQMETFRCSLGSLIGNPVKIGDGPAAVILLFPFGRKREPFWPLCVTVPVEWEGR